jgi:decaprenylphospho-beta-D-ribofuranose 2-oxidase
MLERTSASGRASFLAVLKTLGREGIGCLSFPRPGFTLALDIPHRSDSLELLRDLERLTLEHGGRLYLAKDTALSPEGVAAMYPRLDAFRAVVAEVDPQGRLHSDMARRLRLRNAPG